MLPGLLRDVIFGFPSVFRDRGDIEGLRDFTERKLVLRGLRHRGSQGPHREEELHGGCDIEGLSDHLERKFHGGCSGSPENCEGEFQWFSFSVHGDFGGQLLWPFGIFHFRDALLGFTNVFYDCGNFGLWGSGWGSLSVFSVRAGVRACGVFLLFAFFVPCRPRESRRMCTRVLPFFVRDVLFWVLGVSGAAGGHGPRELHHWASTRAPAQVMVCIFCEDRVMTFLLRLIHRRRPGAVASRATAIHSLFAWEEVAVSPALGPGAPCGLSHP